MKKETEQSSKSEFDEVITKAVLKEYHGIQMNVAKGEHLFEKDDRATHFYFLEKGTIKMTVYNEKGREFIQGYFSNGESFGEPPFFARSRYPASAIAVEKSLVWKLSREDIIALLHDHPRIHLKLTERLSKRLLYKAVMLREIALEEAEHTLATLIRYLRNGANLSINSNYRVPYTRQQLADMTGLRVETVIRTIKSMEDKGVLRIEGGKIVWKAEQKKEN